MPDWAIGSDGVLAALACALRAASVELLLFSAVFILLFGLGDLLIDALWLGNRTMRAPTREIRRGEALVHRLAIFIPAWRGDLHPRVARGGGYRSDAVAY